jgi:hypothetical protein
MPDQPKPSDDKTIPSRPESLRRIVAQAAQSVPPAAPPAAAKHLPWMLAQYFNGEIDLAQELAGRFPQMPLMSLIYFRVQGAKNPIQIATISTQDGAASLRVEIDAAAKITAFTFSLNSMLCARFMPSGLSQLDRAHWLEPLKRESGEIAFLWGAQRFRSDYLIAVSQKIYTNIFAFSPDHTEAAARLTSEVCRKFTAWIEPHWAAMKDEQAEADASSQNLTW